MSQETFKDDPATRQIRVRSSRRMKPWKGNPEKEQRSHVEKDDLERWQKTNTN